MLWTGFPEAYASITLTLFVPLTLAAFGIVLRGSSFAFRKTVFRTRDRRNFGAAFALSSVLVPVLHGRGRRRHRLGPGARRRRRPATRGQLGQPDVDARRRARRRRRAPTSPPSTSCGTPADSATTAMAAYFRRRAIGAAVVAGVVAVRRHLRAARRRRLPVRRADVAGAAARDPVGAVRHRRRSSCCCATPTAAPGCSPSAPSPAS